MGVKTLQVCVHYIHTHKHTHMYTYIYILIFITIFNTLETIRNRHLVKFSQVASNGKNCNSRFVYFIVWILMNKVLTFKKVQVFLKKKSFFRIGQLNATNKDMAFMFERSLVLKIEKIGKRQILKSTFELWQFLIYYKQGLMKKNPTKIKN